MKTLVKALFFSVVLLGCNTAKEITTVSSNASFTDKDIQEFTEIKLMLHEGDFQYLDSNGNFLIREVLITDGGTSGSITKYVTSPIEGSEEQNLSEDEVNSLLENIKKVSFDKEPLEIKRTTPYLSNESTGMFRFSFSVHDFQYQYDFPVRFNASGYSEFIKNLHQFMVSYDFED